MPYGQQTTLADRDCAGFGVFQICAAALVLTRYPWRFATVAGILVLAGCSGPSTQAPIVDGIGAAPQLAAPAQGSYVVKPGDTLHGIARATHVDFETLKRLNSLSDPNQLVVGQVLLLSTTGTVSPAAGGPPKPSGPVAGVKPGVQPAASTPESRAPNASAAVTPPASTPASAQPHPTPAADAGVIKGDWPIKGPLIQRFNAKTMGIDIEGKVGDPIHAAADGEVKYTGNGVRGLGSLIILSHTNGFITVYAHNSKLLVKTGQRVKRGDKIAELGQTDTTSPRLHFEVRRRGTPVDPLQYLPAP
jgi:lipoprotein NlpD